MQKTNSSIADTVCCACLRRCETDIHAHTSIASFAEQLVLAPDWPWYSVGTTLMKYLKVPVSTSEMRL